MNLLVSLNSALEGEKQNFHILLRSLLLITASFPPNMTRVCYAGQGKYHFDPYGTKVVDYTLLDHFGSDPHAERHNHAPTTGWYRYEPYDGSALGTVEISPRAILHFPLDRRYAVGGGTMINRGSASLQPASPIDKAAALRNVEDPSGAQPLNVDEEVALEMCWSLPASDRFPQTGALSVVDFRPYATGLPHWEPPFRPMPYGEHLDCYKVGKECRYDTLKLDPSVVLKSRLRGHFKLMFAGQVSTCKIVSHNIASVTSHVTGVSFCNASTKGKGLLQFYVADEQAQQVLLSWNGWMLYRDGQLLVARDEVGYAQLQEMIDEFARNPTPGTGNPSRCINFELPNLRQPNPPPSTSLPLAGSSETF